MKEMLKEEELKSIVIDLIKNQIKQNRIVDGIVYSGFGQDKIAKNELSDSIFQLMGIYPAEEIHYKTYEHLMKVLQNIDTNLDSLARMVFKVLTIIKTTQEADEEFVESFIGGLLDDLMQDKKAANF